MMRKMYGDNVVSDGVMYVSKCWGICWKFKEEWLMSMIKMGYSKIWFLLHASFSVIVGLDKNKALTHS